MSFAGNAMPWCIPQKKVIKPMSDTEFIKRLQFIAEVAMAQRTGNYSPQEDAMSALKLIGNLALLMIEDRVQHIQPLESDRL